MRSRALGWLTALLLAATGSSAAAQSCDVVFPTPLSAHMSADGSGSFLRFYGGWVSGSPSNVMRAENKLDLSLLPLSCDSASCIANGQPSVALELPTFLTSTSSSTLSTGWFGNTTFQGSNRNFSQVKVGWLGRIRIAPVEQQWRIKNIILDADSTLELAPGDYWVENLSLARASSLQPVGDGTVRLFVKNTLYAPWVSSINQGDGADPSRLVIISWDDISLHDGADIAATLYAADKIFLDEFVNVNGDLAAAEIEMQWLSHVTAMTTAQREATDFGTLCAASGDLDGDGIPDSIDNDIDGDGFSNIDEAAAGTDAEDASDYPDVVAPTLSINLSQPYQQASAQLSLSGNVSDSGGPHAALLSVSVSNLTTGEVVAATLSAGSYSASVGIEFGDNQIAVQALDASGNEATVTAIATRVDSTAPMVSLDGLPSEAVDAVFYSLTGSVSDGDDGSGIAGVSVVNAASPNVQIDVLVEAELFSGEVPLVFGENVITVTATDGFQLQGTATKTVTRIDSVSPEILLSIPSAQQISAASAMVSGSVVDNVDGSGVSAATVSNDRGMSPQTLTLAIDGSFTTSVPLQAGINQFTLTATDFSGNNATANFTITRPDQDNDGIADDVDDDRDGDGYSNEDEIARGTNPDDAADFPDDVAPELIINNASGQTTTANQITVTGSATDDRALSTVTLYSEQYGTSFAVTLDGSGNFSSSVPLKVGQNNLTITATDSSDNSSAEALSINRLSPPVFQAVQPASGAVIDAESVMFTGRVVTELGEDLLRLSINNAQVVFEPREGDGYSFAVSMPLSYGSNQFALRVTSPDGSDAQTLNISRLPENPDSIAPPSITLLAPNDNQWLSSNSVNVVGRASSYAGAVTVRINDTPVNVTGSAESGSFSAPVYFASGEDSLSITVTATDQLARQTSQTVTVMRDTTAPVITLDNDFAPLPADNAVTDSVLVLSGTVADSNLAGMIIDTTSPTLTPTADPNVFSFRRELSLAGGSREILLSAQDDAGNVGVQRYQVTLDPSALLTPILPVAGSRFRANGAPVMVQVAARLAGIAPGATAQVLVNGVPFPVNFTDTLMSGEVALPAQTGSVTLRYEVQHPTSGLVAASELSVDVVDKAAEPLRLDAVTPASNSQQVSPNQLITLLFNKAIDPAQLSLSVKETLHGFTYVNNDAPGTDFVRAKGYELTEVHRDLEPMPGTLDVAPGSRMVSFKPDRFFGYGASVFVEVTYAGELLGRALFNTEHLPTQLSGLLIDQFGQPAGGVTVMLGDMQSVTGKAGGFNFGFVSEQRALKGGTYSLVVNPEGRDPRFGSRLRSVYLDQGRYKKLGALSVPMINDNSGFDVLQSGLISALAGGVVEIDLLDADINDQRGRTTVQVNTQVVEPINLGFESRGSSPLFGMFTLQPEGLEVSGNPRVALPLPRFAGSDELLVDDTPLFVMGLNADRSAMEPVAIAVVSAGRARSQGLWQGEWLDYLGLGPIPAEAQAAVDLYLQGNGDWATVRRSLGMQ